MKSKDIIKTSAEKKQLIREAVESGEASTAEGKFLENIVDSTFSKKYMVDDFIAHFKKWSDNTIAEIESDKDQK